MTPETRREIHQTVTKCGECGFEQDGTDAQTFVRGLVWHRCRRCQHEYFTSMPRPQKVVSRQVSMFAEETDEG